VENGVGRRIVGAFGDPGGFEIATAHMHTDDHVIGAVDYGVVHHLGIATDQPIGIFALGLALGADFRIAEIGKEDVVHLQIAAAGIVEGLHGSFIGGGDVFEIGLGVVLVFLD